MQVFKAFFKIANKHKIPCLIYAGIFLILIMMMSLTSSKTTTSKFEANSVDIVIIDNDHSTLSKAITDYLGEKHNIVELKNYTDETITDHLFYQYISYALTIPEGFEEQFLKGEITDMLKHSMRQDSASGFFVNQQIDAFLQSVKLYTAGGYTLEDSISHTVESTKNQQEVEIVNFEGTAIEKNDTMYYFYQYYAYIVLMILPVGIVPILTTFHESTLSARISCSSLSSRSRNIQLGLGCVTFSMLVWFLFNLIAVIAFKPGEVFSEAGLMCMANSLIMTMISTTFTLILGAFSIKDNALSLITNIIGLGMSFLCGVFVPQWLLGSSVLAVAKFFPAYWYIKIVNMVSGWSGEAYSVESFWKYLGIEAAFFVALFSVYLVASRQRKKASIS